jgi:hypothetical protein
MRQDGVRAAAPVNPAPRWPAGYIEALREAGAKEKTIPYCLGWVRRFFAEHPGRSRRDLGRQEIEAFLGGLAAEPGVTNWRVQQARDALELYYGQFRGIALDPRPLTPTCHGVPPAANTEGPRRPQAGAVTALLPADSAAMHEADVIRGTGGQGEVKCPSVEARAATAAPAELEMRQASAAGPGSAPPAYLEQASAAGPGSAPPAYLEQASAAGPGSAPLAYLEQASAAASRGRGTRRISSGLRGSNLPFHAEIHVRSLRGNAGPCRERSRESAGATCSSSRCLVPLRHPY